MCNQDKKNCISAMLYLNDTMMELYMGDYEETVRKNQNEIFDSMPYPIYLYSHQELSAENVYFKGARHFINISRDRHIHEDHDKGVSTSSISKKYRITSRRVQQILH